MDLHALFAEIVDYPRPQLESHVQECAARLGDQSPETAGLLERFHKFQAGIPLGKLQEAYTSIFDMQPECTLNLGYQLLGDDWRRSILLFQLKEIYQARNFEAGCELPDHLSVVLRFLATAHDSDEAAEIKSDLLVPVLSRMAASIHLGESPYRWILQALLSWLGENRKTIEPDCTNRDRERVTSAIVTGEEPVP
ncbi:MAG TPA: nitrate reductase molybdenum cofactor assembly chaperone [Candidatus Sulfotelmatobacter sp.]|nr:nitrate reductase molybdenum cofactor assembly chaperone [Candidatus Sulfotelmatobacter sp.]